MRGISAISLTVAFSMIICGLAWCERGPADRREERERRAVRPEVEEARKLAERLRELNQQLRGATELTRQNHAVRKAFGRIQELEAALRQAQARANQLLDMAVAQLNPRLVPLIREKNLIQRRLEEIRSQSSERGDRPTEEGARPGEREQRAPRSEREDGK